MQINNGTYPGKIKDYGFRSTKAGDPMIVIVFNVEVADGIFHTMDWTGSFKDKAKQITLKAVAACGFDFNDPQADTKWSDMALGTMSGVLDLETAVSLSIENEPYEGNLVPKIRWVNAAGGGRFKNLFSRDEAQHIFSGMDILGAGRALQGNRPPEPHVPKLPPVGRMVTPDTEMPF